MAGIFFYGASSPKVLKTSYDSGIGMRVKLLNLPNYHHTSIVDNCLETQFPFVPSGLPVIAALLRQNGFRVDQDDLNAKLFDVNINCNGKEIALEIMNDERRIRSFIESGEDPELEAVGEQILNLTRTKGYDLVAFSAYEAVGPSTTALLHLLSSILKRRHDPFILVGGRMPEEVQHHLLEKGSVDFTFRGTQLYPGHTSFLELCECLAAGTPPGRVACLRYLQDGCVKYTGLPSEEESFITPDFEGLPLEMYRRNRQIVLEGYDLKDDILALPLSFIRGCQFSCAFCSHSSEVGWYAQDPESVASMLVHLSRRYGTMFFYFLNSNVNPTKEYAMQLCKALMEADANILWTDCANFHHTDRTLIERLSEAGAARLVFGVESASPRLLRFIRKPLDIAHAERIIKETRRHRIWSELDLIAGLPTENDDDITRTIQFLRRNQEHYETYNLFKFWLEGDFRNNPERYGLKIIGHDDSRIAVPWDGRGFHEQRGLTWEDKVQQTNRSFNRIEGECPRKRRPHDSLYTFPFRSENHLKFIYHVTDLIYRSEMHGEQRNV